MRTAGVDPSRRLLEGALELALRQQDGKLRALLANVASEVVPNKNSNLHSRLSNARLWRGGGGQGSGPTADRWDAQSDSSNGGSNGSSRYSSRAGSNGSSSSRGGGWRASSSSNGSSGSSSSAVDSWRPGMPEGERRQQMQQQQQQQWEQQELAMVDEWVKPGNGGLGGSSTRVAELRAMLDKREDK